MTVKLESKSVIGITLHKKNMDIRDLGLDLVLLERMHVFKKCHNNNYILLDNFTRDQRKRELNINTII